MSKKFLSVIDMTANQIKNVAAPTQYGDVATYEWVTGLIEEESKAIVEEAKQVSILSKEIAQGVTDGENREFTLNHAPVLGSELVFVNGLLQMEGVGYDYILISNTLIFEMAPLPGTRIICSYRSDATQ